MTYSAPDFVSRLLGFAPVLVGLVFLLTGSIKAVNPNNFHRHLYDLGLVPKSLIPALVTAAAGLEAGWGMLLIMRIAPAVVLPASIVLLV